MSKDERKEIEETEKKIIEKINEALDSVQSFQKDNQEISLLKYDTEILLNTISRNVTKKSTSKMTTNEKPSICIDAVISDLKNYIPLVDSDKSIKLMNELLELKGFSNSFKKIETKEN